MRRFASATDMKNQIEKILITGATGFLGNSLGKALSLVGRYSLKAQVRKSIEISWAEEVFQISNLSSIERLNSIFEGIDVVIHCAARVHIMNDTSSNPLDEFQKVNVDGSISLAKLAAKSGVRRFIFISSIKVNGEDTEDGKVYKADDIPAPQDPYGVSKMEAEEGLKQIAAETGMELVIIRPVLVYGPGVKANFLNMMRWLHKGVPLPLGSIKNKRSLVALGNLIDLIKTCIDHPAAASETFIAADGEDLSTTDLLLRMSNALGTRARLLPVPQRLLIACATVLGKKPIAQRLCGSLQVDISKAQKILGWKPPLSVDDGLKLVANSYLTAESK